jgi:hypothetical protein
MVHFITKLNLALLLGHSVCSPLDFSFLFHTSAVQCEFVVLVTALGDTILVANLGELCAISENNLSYCWFIFRHRKS